MSIIQEILDTWHSKAPCETSCDESVLTPSGATPLEQKDTPVDVTKSTIVPPIHEVQPDIGQQLAHGTTPTKQQVPRKKDPVLHEPSASSTSPRNCNQKRPRRSKGPKCAEFRDELTINYS